MSWMSKISTAKMMFGFAKDSKFFRDIVELARIEMNLAVVEIKTNLDSTKKATIEIAVGTILLLLSSISLIGFTLAFFFPIWFAAMVFMLLLTIIGATFLFLGISRMKNVSLVPVETLQRVNTLLEQMTAGPKKNKAEAAAGKSAPSFEAAAE